MKVLSPFGPKIAIIKIPKNIINKINQEVDLILNNKKRLEKSDYSNKLVGQVKQEIKLSSKFIKKNQISINKFSKLIKKNQKSIIFFF